MKNARPANTAKPSAVDKRNCTAQLHLFEIDHRLRPTAPERGSRAWLALADMLRRGAITQRDWLRSKRGWRLAAAIKALRYAGWQIEARWVLPAGCVNRIKQYQLTQDAATFAKQAVKKWGAA